MRVRCILETCLYATDLDAAARFYGETLGLIPVSRAAGRHAFFRCGDQMLLLFDPSATERSEEVPPHGARGPGHVAFAAAADELQAWTARLRAAGIPIEREVRWPGGGRSLYLRDPAGNSIELATPSIWGMPAAASSDPG